MESNQLPKIEPAMAYPVDKAGKLIGISERTIRRWVANREIESAKIGGRTLIPHDALQAMVDRHRIKVK